MNTLSPICILTCLSILTTVYAQISTLSKAEENEKNKQKEDPAKTAGKYVDDVIQSLQKGNSQAQADQMTRALGEMLNVQGITNLVSKSTMADTVNALFKDMPGTDLIPGLDKGLKQIVAQGAVDQFTRPLQRLTDGAPIGATDVTDIINAVPDITKSLPVKQQVDFNKIPSDLIDHLMTDGYIPGIPQSTTDKYLRAYMAKMADTAQSANSGDETASKLMLPYEKLPKVVKLGAALPGINETQLDEIKKYYGPHFPTTTVMPTTTEADNLTITEEPTTSTPVTRPNRVLYNINESDRTKVTAIEESAMGDDTVILLSAIGVSVFLLIALGAAIAFIVYYRRKSKSMQHSVNEDVTNVQASNVQGDYSYVTGELSYMQGQKLFSPGGSSLFQARQLANAHSPHHRSGPAAFGDSQYNSSLASPGQAQSTPFPGNNARPTSDL